MPHYKPLSAYEAPKYMQSVWNLHFKPLSEDNFFVEPWTNRAFADCAEFSLSPGDAAASSIHFFIKDKRVIAFLTDTSGPLYLYGAYNQVKVCQMRTKGTVSLVADNTIILMVKERLRNRIIKKTNAFVSGISEEEAEERMEMLEKGYLFRFQPEEYAYAMYERG